MYLKYMIPRIEVSDARVGSDYKWIQRPGKRNRHFTFANLTTTDSKKGCDFKIYNCESSVSRLLCVSMTESDLLDHVALHKWKENISLVEDRRKVERDKILWLTTVCLVLTSSWTGCTKYMCLGIQRYSFHFH